MKDITQRIEEIIAMKTGSNFAREVEIFSWFICNINRDYVYNETYLRQFWSDFEQFKRHIKMKNGIYLGIVEWLSRQPEVKEVIIDDVYRYERGVASGYIDINCAAVNSDSISLRVTLLSGNTPSVFSKVYKTGQGLQTKIKDDIIKMKGEATYVR